LTQSHTNLKNTVTDKRKIRLTELKEKIENDGENTAYFKSRLHELAFYFSQAAQHQTSIFDGPLYIGKVHGIDPQKARELRKIYLSLFHNSKFDELMKKEIDGEQVNKDIAETFSIVTNGKLK
jgi:hypothetical protein